MKFFNTAGPVNTEDHYTLSPLVRINLEEILSLIDQKKYFVLHAPRQTGKTSCLLALMNRLNQEGNYRCLYVNVEAAQAAREDVAEAIHTIGDEMISCINDMEPERSLLNQWLTLKQQNSPFQCLSELFKLWTQQSPCPTVLLLDEIDSLVGDTLISVLRQIRSGYTKRPLSFPQSIILCGVRDVRDYRMRTDEGKTVITGGSAFNIKAESLRLGNFTQDEVQRLYEEHTQETGQVFTADATQTAWDLTEGQPWLVNALAYEVCFKMKEGKNRQLKITAEMIQQARENLILRRETHLDQLADKLLESRVKNVINLLLTGSDPQSLPEDDIQYVTDLGLIVRKPQLRIANPIYREIIPRTLTQSTQETITQQTSWYVMPDGRLDTSKLLGAFQEFFREHSQSWLERFQYKEAGPQLLMQAFLQRIINGGGRIEREYGLGMKRTDLLLIWPFSGGQQKTVIELKVPHRQSLEKVLAEGLQQTWNYMDISGTDDGHLVLFDKDPNKSWKDKIWHSAEACEGKTIHVWAM
ncbi:MAG: AAA-like domain-containing protein [SAR324 cluster bacterium]|nr:AAA-like domain-containing protein [SAR324 cluster bacterium]